MIYRVQEHLRGAISFADFLTNTLYCVIRSYDLHCSCTKHSLCTNTEVQSLYNFVFRCLDSFSFILLFTLSPIYHFVFSPQHLPSHHLSSPPYLLVGPPCSLLTSCSSWSCCYLKPRLVARVETPARSTMAGCQPHQLVPSWSPVWLRPSRVSSWAGWVCSRSPTQSPEYLCPSTSWIFTASTSSSTIYWRTLCLASPASTSSRLTLYAASTTMVSSLAHHKPGHQPGLLTLQRSYQWIILDQFISYR